MEENQFQKSLRKKMEQERQLDEALRAVEKKRGFARHLSDRRIFWFVGLGALLVIYVCLKSLQADYRKSHSQKDSLQNRLTEERGPREIDGWADQIVDAAASEAELNRDLINHATVLYLLGNAKTDKSKTIHLHDALPLGTTVITGPQSVIKLLYPDNSQYSLGSESMLKIEMNKPEDPGMINLVEGTLRANINKQYDAEKGKVAKEKLIIKTATATMGIRGTDFHVFVSEDGSTELITFEGSVAMSRLQRSVSDPVEALQANKVVQMVSAGLSSTTAKNTKIAAEPQKVSPEELTSLRKNSDPQITLTLMEKEMQYGVVKNNAKGTLRDPIIKEGIAAQFDHVKRPPSFLMQDNREFPDLEK